jgi:hypothetical protein
MTDASEKQLTGLIAMIASAAFFPTMCVIANPPQTGVLRYNGEDDYPTTPYEKDNENHEV